jgi:hypothetical protein
MTFSKAQNVAWDEQSLAFALTAAARGNTARRGALNGKLWMTANY